MDNISIILQVKNLSLQIGKRGNRLHYINVAQENKQWYGYIEHKNTIE